MTQKIAKKCIQLPDEIRSETVKRLFTNEYGDPNRITVAYRKEIKHCSQIKASNADLHQRLRNYRPSMKSMCWIHLKSCACYLQNCQAIIETYVLEM